MAEILNRDEAPGHLFEIPELDFSADLFTDPSGDSWFRLGAWTISPNRSAQQVEDVQSRQSLLLDPGGFTDVYDILESVGNVINDMGKPGGVVFGGAHREYKYFPFHRFQFSFTSQIGEPLVFTHDRTSGIELFINPDLWLFFDLEERSPGSGIWWDPKHGVDVLFRRIIGSRNLEVVEIRTDYLLKYLKSRQMSLVVGHYRHLHLYDPHATTIEKFVTEEVRLGSPAQGAKAILQNWGLRQNISQIPFLQRRLHLWYEIRPPEIDIDEPWAEPPYFDIYTFTLPTSVGPVAPARWKHFRLAEGRTFEGDVCEFLDLIYFRQEVLAKYQGSTGFEIADDGSVSCHSYWGLTRSTSRVGNELLSTAIGDFAEGVPFEEWPHWKQYAVERPSNETEESLRQEITIPHAVNCLVDALHVLNKSFCHLADSVKTVIKGKLWNGSLESLAGRQVKWIYPSDADDDEFLKRATLTSTLVIEALEPASLREVLRAFARDLHMNYEAPPRPLGSRNLLQRLSLIASLIETFRSEKDVLSTLVKQAEGKCKIESDPELQSELEHLFRTIRDEFSPLAFLYDLRTFGGLAHTPNKVKAASAAAQLGLPEKNWHRIDYLRLLELITDSVYKISTRFEKAAFMVTDP